MRWFPTVLAPSMVSLVACTGDVETERAQALVAQFEQAVRAGNRALVRELVTFESRAAVDAMALLPQPAKAALVIAGTTSKGLAQHVRVRDPNERDRNSTFVVVPENGDLRIDLVATAGLTAREVFAQDAAATRTVIRPLTPAQLEAAGRLAR